MLHNMLPDFFFNCLPPIYPPIYGLPYDSDGKESACVQSLGLEETRVQSLGSEDPLGKIPWNGYPLQYSCLENSMDIEAWWAIVHGVAKSHTQLSS